MGAPRPDGVALVVGKLCPLHLGHLWLLERALERADRLCALTYTSLRAPGCSAPQRQAWLDALLAPYGDRAVSVALPPALCPPDEAPAEVHRLFCAEVARARGWAVDVVCTSESYGDGFAEVLSRELGRPVRHVCVDLARARVPVSGTMMREAFEVFSRDPGGVAGRAALERLRGGVPGVVFESLVGGAL